MGQVWAAKLPFDAGCRITTIGQLLPLGDDSMSSIPDIRTLMRHCGWYQVVQGAGRLAGCCPARGYFNSSACGRNTPGRSACRSASHSARAYRSCSFKATRIPSGSMTTRSLPPFPSRTMITLRSKSRSFTRSDNASRSRKPVPYSRPPASR